MLYGSKTWTLCRHHIKLLRTVQQRHLRSFLKISWDPYITNDEILDCSKSAEIEITLIRNRLSWIGHVACMPDEQPVKALLYGELTEGSRKVGCPLLRYEDAIKINTTSSVGVHEIGAERSWETGWLAEVYNFN